MKPLIALTAFFLISACTTTKQSVRPETMESKAMRLPLPPPATQRIVSAPPADVIAAVFRAAVDQRGFDPSSLEQTVSALPKTVVDGGVVSTIVDANTFACASRNFDLVPADIWKTLCANGGRVNRYFVSAQPGIPSGRNQAKAIPSKDAESLTLYLDDAQKRAALFSLTLDDVTQAFDLAWTGHLPRMETVHSFASPGHLLMTVHSERGPERPQVSHVVVYWRAKNT